MPDAQVVPCGCAGNLGHRRDVRGFDHRPPGGLPLAESRQRLLVGDGLGGALVGDLRIARPAIAHQPRQPAIGLIARGRPPRHHLGLGPGQGDVHQAAVVTRGLAATKCRGLGVLGAAATADVQAPDSVVVEQDVVALLHIAVEREGEVDDRELQALAAVHGHHLHRCGVAVEPAVVLGLAALLLATVAQPVTQRREAEVLAVRRLLKQLCQVGHVGHVPLAAAPGQCPIGHAAQPGRLVHRRHPAVAGVVGPLPDGVRDAVGQRITLIRKLFGGMAEEHRGGDGAHQSGAVRLVERLQQGQPVVAGIGGEDVGIPRVDGRYSRLDQSVEAGAGILALLDDHGDVPGPDPFAGEGGRAGQQSGDVGGQVPADERTQVVDADQLVALAAEGFPWHHAQPERVVAGCAGQSTARVMGLDVVHDDARVAEFGAAQHGL